MIVLAPSRLRHISHMPRNLSKEIAPLRVKIRHLPANGTVGQTGLHLTFYARVQLTSRWQSPHCLSILSGGT